jgi:hypothetical protein
LKEAVPTFSAKNIGRIRLYFSAMPMFVNVPPNGCQMGLGMAGMKDDPVGGRKMGRPPTSARPRSAIKAPVKPAAKPAVKSSSKPAAREDGIVSPAASRTRGGSTGRNAGTSGHDHRQLTLPVINSPLIGDIQNGRQIMMHSYFAHGASKRNPVTELPTFDDGKIRIEVRSTKVGVATIDDAEMLLFCMGLANDRLARGEDVGQEFTFTLKDFCDVSGLSQSGSVSKRLGDALERLKETNVKTNIEAGKKVYVEGFSWIEKYWFDRGADETVKGKKRSGKINSVTVRFCDFLWRAIVIDRNLLSYSREFFTLSPLKRRLYEIARVHCHARPAFGIGLESLRDRIGTAQELKKFKDELVRMLGDPSDSPIPGFRFRIDTGQAGSKRPRLAKAVVQFWVADREITGITDIPRIDATYLTDLRST